MTIAVSTVANRLHTYTPAIMEVLIRGRLSGKHLVDRARLSAGCSTQAPGRRWVGDSGPHARQMRYRRQPDRSTADTTKPFSHMVTGMALRALVAHPRYRRSSAAKVAAALLKSRFFKPDKYPDRRGREFWTRFTYPFGYTDLLTSLDSLGRLGSIGFAREDPDIAVAIAWFRDKQNQDGSFELEMRRGTSDKRLPYWLGLALCRALERFET